MTYGQWPGQNEQQGEQAGRDGQPPDWRYGQQPDERGNGQGGYAPGQYQPQPRFQPTQPLPPGPQPPPPPPRGKSWPARHKALTGIFAFAALIIIIAAANSGGSSSSPGGGTTTGLSTTPSATATATATGAPSQHAAAATRKARPTRAQTTSAAAHAPARPAPARTTPAPTTPAPPPPAPTTPAPARTTAAAVAPAPPAAPAGCHPLTSGGNCYEPGEFCRNSDHGASGVAGDGKPITCENNDGWRWEPS